jgi:lysozyme family protein
MSGQPVSAGFETSLPFVLRWEGGFVDNPADPGGRTNRGVTQKVYDRWRQEQNLPPRDVKLLDEPEMQAIYRAGYWVPGHCAELISPLDLVEFDTAVNMGVGRAIRFLQKAAGCQVDGAFGRGTRDALEACDQGSTVIAYCDAREGYYRALVVKNPKLGIFLNGWLNRLNALRRQAGLPGYDTALPLDFGDAGFIARIPDLGENPDFDL